MTTRTLKSLSDETLTERLRELSKRDLALTSEIVSHIHEFMIRRLYLDQGCTSLFGYLTEKLGYSRATAQNRIDAARLLHVAPEIGKDLATGKINLSQITLMAMGVRQAEKETPGLQVSIEQKLGLIEKLKTLKPGDHESAQVVAQELDIKIRPFEKIRVHQDGSVTLEVYLSKEEFQNLKRVREITAHRNYDATLGETVAEAVKFFLEKKDPLKLKTPIVAPEIGWGSNLEFRSNLGARSNVEFSSSPNLKSASSDFRDVATKRTPRKYLSVGIVRAIYQRDKSCRWIDPATGAVCGSTYQLQIDHIRGLVDAGENNIENLELKCAVHNRRKFELERVQLVTSVPPF